MIETMKLSELPEGMTCGDCVTFEPCASGDITNSERTDCNFSPSRFVQVAFRDQQIQQDMSEPVPDPVFEDDIGWCSASCPFYMKRCPAYDLIPSYDPEPWRDDSAVKVCFMWLRGVLAERDKLRSE